MKCPRPIGLVLVTILSLAYSMPTETTTTTSTRLTPAFGDSIKKLTNQLMDVNTTKLDMVSDTRTPPKVKQQVKLKEEMENSHAGVAIPVDDDAIEMDETTKKMNFYKLERPTTNSGLSTWILLSGQSSATTKSPTTRKPVIKPVSENSTKENITMVVSDKPNRIVKPIFRKRTPSTPKPSTTTKATTFSTTTKVTTEQTKLTKVKASLLKNATTKKTASTTEQPTTTTLLVTNKNSTVENSTLPAEAKEGDVDLNNNAEKKKKTTNKRRKNKPKRRKPADKSNSTSISKPNKTLNKQNAISTQLYNYLAREIMPTVGVGLVGLMVTAGLASYFLYPFGAARRYDIDRKDKEGSYYYSDEYSGGIPEEEAIGKVIAGMPSNTLFPSNYKTPTSRDTYPNTKYRLTDRRSQIRPQYYGDVVQGPAENIPVTPKPYNYQSNSFEPITYTNDQGSGYSSNSDQKFVVGNIPKEVVEEATPAAVPEHGPRNLKFENIRRDEYGPRYLKIRRKRSGMSNEIENEIDNMFTKDDDYTTTIDSETTEMEKEVTTMMSSTQKSSTTSSTPTSTVNYPVSSFFDMMKDLIQFKARLGLQIIHNITSGISKYISGVQTRLDEQFRNMTKRSN